MALTQQRRPVEGVLGSPPGVPAGPFFVNLIIFSFSEGSWGVLGGPLRSGVSGRVRGGVGRSQGRSDGAPGEA